MTRLVTITSGKGGVGKTNISINLALYLAAKGLRTCLFDADLGLANINVLLGIYPPETLRDVLFSGKSMTDILVKYEDGFDILPGSSGVAEMVDLDPQQVEKLIRSFLALEAYDFFLFDTSAGISKDVLAFCLAAPEILVVITPEPTSLTDAYALVKILVHNGYQGKIRVAVNLCKNASIAKSSYGKFKAAVKKFLGVDITSLGMIYEDDMVPQAVSQQKPVATLYPRTYASQCIKKLADRLVADTEGSLDATGIKAFWEKCLSVLKNPPQYGGKLKIEPEPSITISVPAVNKPDESPSEAGPITTEKAQVRSPGPDSENSEESMAAIAEKISGTLNTIAEEMARLRQSMEKMGSLSSQEGPSSGGRSTTQPNPESIALDFDAYLKRRQ